MPITSLLGLEDEYTFEDLVEQQDSLLLEIEQEERTSVLRVNFSVIQKEHGKIDGLIAVIYDVTEQEQIDQERREFVANVSHEAQNAAHNDAQLPRSACGRGMAGSKHCAALLECDTE